METHYLLNKGDVQNSKKFPICNGIMNEWKQRREISSNWSTLSEIFLSTSNATINKKKIYMQLMSKQWLISKSSVKNENGWKKWKQRIDLISMIPVRDLNDRLSVLLMVTRMKSILFDMDIKIHRI